MIEWKKVLADTQGFNIGMISDVKIQYTLFYNSWLFLFLPFVSDVSQAVGSLVTSPPHKQANSLFISGGQRPWEENMHPVKGHIAPYMWLEAPSTSSSITSNSTLLSTQAD